MCLGREWNVTAVAAVDLVRASSREVNLRSKKPATGFHATAGFFFRSPRDVGPGSALSLLVQAKCQTRLGSRGSILVNQVLGGRLIQLLRDLAQQRAFVFNGDVFVFNRGYVPFHQRS